jgi:DNA-binding XRE family transcriptional regulator
VANAAGLPRFTLSRIERGTHRPTYDTARALATWLGWTVDEVMVAAETPVEQAGESA